MEQIQIQIISTIDSTEIIFKLSKERTSRVPLIGKILANDMKETNSNLITLHVPCVKTCIMFLLELNEKNIINEINNLNMLITIDYLGIDLSPYFGDDLLLLFECYEIFSQYRKLLFKKIWPRLRNVTSSVVLDSIPEIIVNELKSVANDRKIFLYKNELYDLKTGEKILVLDISTNYSDYFIIQKKIYLIYDFKIDVIELSTKYGLFQYEMGHIYNDDGPCLCIQETKIINNNKNIILIGYKWCRIMDLTTGKTIKYFTLNECIIPNIRIAEFKNKIFLYNGSHIQRIEFKNNEYVLLNMEVSNVIDILMMDDKIIPILRDHRKDKDIIVTNYKEKKGYQEDSGHQYFLHNDKIWAYSESYASIYSLDGKYVNTFKFGEYYFGVLENVKHSVLDIKNETMRIHYDRFLVFETTKNKIRIVDLGDNIENSIEYVMLQN